MMDEYSEKLFSCNEEVYYFKGSLVSVDWALLTWLKERAQENIRRRARICAHPRVDDFVHEMIIVHSLGNYIPPHKHYGKSESFHMIDGEMRVVIFSDDGRLVDVITLSSISRSVEKIYYRLQDNLFHCIIPLTEFVIFHEVTRGPFREQDTVIAGWAPAEEAEHDRIDRFQQRLKNEVMLFLKEMD